MDSSKSNGSKQGSNVKGKKKFPHSLYMADIQLIQRVDKYLENKMDHEVIDRDAMVEHLRQHYREYGRRNKAAFRAAVFKAFNIVMQTSLNSENRNESSSELDVSSEDSEDVDEDDIYINQFQHQNASGSKRSNGPMSYIQSVQKMTNCNKNNNASQELINISSDDDDKPAKMTPKTIVPAEKTVEVTIPKINLPSGTRLFSPATTTPLTNSDQSLLLRKRKGEPMVSLLAKKTKSDAASVPKQTFKDFGGKREILETVSQIIMHMKHPEIYRKLGVSPPRGFLLHGPPGSGKTLLANVIAGELNVPIVKVAAPELVAGVSGESELRIRELFEQAKNQVPCVLFIDEVDAITPRRDTAQKDMERRIVAQLLASLDELSSKPECDQILVIGATNRPDSLDPALRRAGRFDREICIGIPDNAARESILKVICANLRIREGISLKCLADLTPGYVGADLKALISEAAIAAVNRTICKVKCERELKESQVGGSKNSENTSKNETTNEVTNEATNETTIEITNGTHSDGGKDKDDKMQTAENEKMKETSEEKKEEEDSKKCNEMEVDNIAVDKGPDTTKIVQDKSTDHVNISTEVEVLMLHNSSPLTEKQLEDLYIEMEDFNVALKTVQPSAKREGFATVPDVTWDDIGSLQDIRDQLQMSIMMPVKYPEEFARLGVNSPTGILLCGPPGCGKTLLAKAVANEANINFISVKGPELLNMYVGESERAVRQCFQRARNSQPCVIFFDEIDALCPKRSDSVEGSASSRVVNQLLTEMDGVEGRNGVFLMAATNRPDMVDPAVMRPGRFDKILYVGLPNPQDRSDILRALTKNGTKPPFESDVDLSSVASGKSCTGYTGADLSALIKEASVQALSEFISSDKSGDLVVRTKHLQMAIDKIRPSVSDKDHKLYELMRLQYTVPESRKKN